MARILVAWATLIVAMTVTAVAANAAEIKLLSAGGMRPVLGDLVRDFERTSGHTVVISYGTGGATRDRVLNGEAVDLAILPRPLMDELLKQGKIVPSSTANIAHTDVGIGVRIGAPKPDISSIESFKRSLLAVKSIIYPDPEKGGASGIYFVRVLNRLGISDLMKPKTKLLAQGYTAEFVAKGEAEMAVQLGNEILAVPGIEFVPLPPELQTTDFTFSGGIAVSAKEPDAARALIRALAAPTAIPIIKSRNMEPG